MTNPSREMIGEALTAFLTRKDTYGRISPLEKYVQDEVERMARALAVQVVEANPDLTAKITRLVQSTLDEAMRNDQFFNEAIVKAVAAAITKHRSGDDG